MCHTEGKGELRTNNWLERLKERDLQVNIDVEGRIILKRNLYVNVFKVESWPSIRQFFCNDSNLQL